ASGGGERRGRSRGAHPLDEAEGDAAAAVDREPGRLVERDQRVVFEENRRKRAARGSRWRSPAAWGGRADRGDSELIADVETRIRPDSLPVHPDFAAAKD